MDNEHNSETREIQNTENISKPEVPQSPGSKTSDNPPEDTQSAPSSDNQAKDTENAPSTDEQSQTSKLTKDDLLSDIADSEQLSNLLTGIPFGALYCEDFQISPTLGQTTDTLKNINSIKDELCKLPLDICEMEYITNNINPLLNILLQLSTTTYNLSTTVSLLATSSVVHPKRHELKDTTHLCYRINDKCEDIYDCLKKRINFVLKNKQGGC